MYKKHRFSIAELAILQVAVLDSLVQSLLINYLCADGAESQSWKNVIWNCRRGQRLPKDLRYMGNKDLWIGHIANPRQKGQKGNSNGPRTYLQLTEDDAPQLPRLDLERPRIFRGELYCRYPGCSVTTRYGQPCALQGHYKIKHDLEFKALKTSIGPVSPQPGPLPRPPIAPLSSPLGPHAPSQYSPDDNPPSGPLTQQQWALFRMKLSTRGSSVGVCAQCRMKDKAEDLKPNPTDRTYFYRPQNNMGPGKVPSFLPELIQVEEMLTSFVHTIIEVRQVRGQQYFYRGHVAHLVTNILKIYYRPPLLPSWTRVT
ncbi:hypothetical protein PENPOL_c021G00966 [Penicillium polonicum]|uniref:DUF6570 domain-containing protein n=1 Tax=Penicillium polonicum TaxID=60169 RepID=A0A1V6N7L8_PENPO|nr:hypothetical protein PENPOL_c021G00966 [Penicillium polonicum]